MATDSTFDCVPLRVSPPEGEPDPAEWDELSTDPSGLRIVAEFHDARRAGSAADALAEAGIPFEKRTISPQADDPVQATRFLFLVDPEDFESGADAMEVIEEMVPPLRSSCPRCGSSDVSLGTRPRDVPGFGDIAGALAIGFISFVEGIAGKRFRCRQCRHRWI